MVRPRLGFRHSISVLVSQDLRVRFGSRDPVVGSRLPLAHNQMSDCRSQGAVSWERASCSVEGARSSIEYEGKVVEMLDWQVPRIHGDL
jgi:hypothetical protein